MWATYPCGELRDGCEESTSQLRTFFLEKVTYEIRYFIEWGCNVLEGATSLGVVCLLAAVLILSAFFLDLPVACLGTTVCLGSGFSGLVVSWWHSL